jgi:hypothetical protein
MNANDFAQPPSRYRAGSLKQVLLGRWQATLAAPRRAAQAIRLFAAHHSAAVTPAARHST